MLATVVDVLVCTPGLKNLGYKRGRTWWEVSRTVKRSH